MGKFKDNMNMLYNFTQLSNIDLLNNGYAFEYHPQNYLGKVSKDGQDILVHPIEVNGVYYIDSLQDNGSSIVQHLKDQFNLTLLNETEIYEQR